MASSGRERPYRKGVGAVVFDAAGRVLVARRTDTPGAWQLPQGGTKAGEKPSRAIRRELAEELGTDRFEIVARSSRWLRYDLPEELAATVWGGRYRGQEQRWFAVRFTGRDADIDVRQGDDPEFDAWRWIELAELPTLAVWFKRRLYEEIVREFAHLTASYDSGQA